MCFWCVWCSIPGFSLYISALVCARAYMPVCLRVCIDHGDITRDLFPTAHSSSLVNESKHFNLIMSHRVVLWEYYCLDGSYTLRKAPSLQLSLSSFFSLVYCSCVHIRSSFPLNIIHWPLIPQPSEDTLWLFIKPTVCLLGGRIPLDSHHHEAIVLSCNIQLCCLQKVISALL